MNTLLLRLAGPMQSWGTRSRFVERDTGLEPSKSGVIGLLCAALGRPRSAAIDDLSALRFGVRIDREGRMQRDFQTADGVADFQGKRSKFPAVSNRYYLADADFLVGFAGADLDQLREMERAVQAPVWQLSLGRKAFVPALPVALPGRGGVREGLELVDALRAEPWSPRPSDTAARVKQTKLRYVLETDAFATNERRMDQPGPGAAFEHRHFLPRYVYTDFWSLGDDVPVGGEHHE